MCCVVLCCVVLCCVVRWCVVWFVVRCVVLWCVVLRCVVRWCVVCCVDVLCCVVCWVVICCVLCCVVMCCVVCCVLCVVLCGDVLRCVMKCYSNSINCISGVSVCPQKCRIFPQVCLHCTVVSKSTRRGGRGGTVKLLYGQSTKHHMKCTCQVIGVSKYNHGYHSCTHRISPGTTILIWSQLRIFLLRAAQTQFGIPLQYVLCRW